MYEPGKVLYVGGGPPPNTAEIIDLNQPSPAWAFTGSMAFARRQMNATVLPTGQVLVTGGTSGGGFNNRSEEHTSELQSQSNLVCRLLLEKKKIIVIRYTYFVIIYMNYSHMFESYNILY